MGRIPAVLFLGCACTLAALRAEPATQNATIQAAPAVDPAMREKVAKLIKRLGAEDFSEREAAKKELIALRIAALPAMREFLGKSKVEEVEAGLKTAIDAVLENQVLDPGNISVNFESAKSQQVAEELSKAMGGKILGERNYSVKDVELTLKMKDKPFWEVAKAINEKVPLEMFPGTEAGKFDLTNLDRKNVYRSAVVSGPFLTMPTAFSRSQRIDMVSGKKNDEFSFGMHCLVDPRTPVLVIKPPVFKEIRDSAGNNIQLDRRSSSNSGEAYTQFGIFNRDLIYPENAGKKVRIAGEITICVCLESQVIEIADVEKLPGGKAELGGYTAIVSDLKVVKNELVFTWNSAIPPTRDARKEAPPGEFVISDATGRRVAFMRVGSSTIWPTRDLVPVPPFRAQFKVPVSYKEFTIPFEFKDLPMP